MAFINFYLQSVLSLGLLLFVLGLCAFQASSRPLDGKQALSMIERHEQWMARHGRVYKDAIEKEKRFHIFIENLKRIEDFNKGGNKSYTLGLNSFSDLTKDEFIATRTGYKGRLITNSSTSRINGFTYENLNDVPSSMDWREKGAVTGIKDQRNCGCCWAFSAVAAVEGLNQIKNGNLISLSEQELLDCDMNNNGCGGGYMDKAFTFIQKNQGLATEEQYPYRGQQMFCRQNGATGGAVTINSFEYVPQNDEMALMQAVAQQPVSVAIDASDDFHHYPLYKDGIFKGQCSTNLNHAVTIIGYGTDPSSGMDYWLIKNSWGESWGEGGYMRMLRGSNLCGIASQASYPTM